METKEIEVKATIYLIGDIHVGNDTIFISKKKLIDDLIKKAKADPDAIVIIPGDLTDDGSGKGQLICFPCFTCTNNCSGENQAEDFIDNVYLPLSKSTKNLYISHGNHDEGTDNTSYPMVDFIRTNYGATKKGCYSFQKNNICFVCLGKYPDSDALDFFSTVINETKDQFPYVVFYHYNIEGPYSEFWTDTEKTCFKNFIDGKKILCILHGHIHQTYASVIQTQTSKFPTFAGSDLMSYAKLDINGTNINFNYVSP